MSPRRKREDHQWLLLRRLDAHITASKFAVLSMDTEDKEDEEGEIRATDSKAGTEVGTEDGVVNQTDTTVAAKQIKEGKNKGGKAKKARSQDVNPMAMSTRSSCRHHLYVEFLLEHPRVQQTFEAVRG